VVQSSRGARSVDGYYNSEAGRTGAETTDDPEANREHGLGMIFFYIGVGAWVVFGLVLIALAIVANWQSVLLYVAVLIVFRVPGILLSLAWFVVGRIAELRAERRVRD